MFREEDGRWSVGALKHSHVFPNFYQSPLSSLYRLSTVHQKLTEDEKILEEVSQFIAGSNEKGRALWNLFFLHGSISESEIRNFIERNVGGNGE